MSVGYADTNRLTITCAACLFFNLPPPRPPQKTAEVPPGRFMSQGLVRWCPQGFFREGFVNMDAANSTSCRPCNPGITTAGAGSVNASACATVLPGYGLSNIANVNGVASIPALPQVNAATGLPLADICPIGFYSLGGFCAQCPGNTTTLSKGARTVDECMVPPGYSLATGVLAPCSAGKYRSGCECGRGVCSHR